MTKSDKLKLAILQYVIGDAGDFGSAGARYVRLWTTAPALDGTGGVEVTGGAYAATEAATSGKFPAVVSGSDTIANDVDVVFPTATAAWGTVVAYTISTAATGTTTFLRIVPVPSTVILSGTIPTIAAGGIIVKET